MRCWTSGGLLRLSPILWRSQEVEAEALPDASRSFRAIRAADLRVGLISNIWRPYEHGARRVLPSIFCGPLEADPRVFSYEVGIMKPDVRIYRHALAVAGEPARNAVMIGDSYKNDIAPALSLGMRTVWLLHRPSEESAEIRSVLAGRLPVPDHLCRSIEEVRPALVTELVHASGSSVRNGGARLQQLRQLEKGHDVRVLSHEIIDEVMLLDRLQQTRLKGYGQERVYRNAKLELLEQVSPDELAPAQRYVLRSNLAAIVELRQTMLLWGIDIFALRGGAWVSLAKNLETHPDEAPSELVSILPPIVEESHEADGRLVWLINDGIHRIYAARKADARSTLFWSVMSRRNIRTTLMPPPGDENDVRELDELPDNFQKKDYRFPQNYKALFRDFDSIFPGVQVQRKRSNPEFFRS